MNHPVTWIICLLHSNELPLRSYFEFKDGKTKGPKLFSGPIGQIITNKSLLKERPLENFERIETEALPELDVKNLSRDQQYFYKIVISVKHGSVSNQLFNASLPTVHHARFINLGSTVLRYYITEANPSKELLDLVNFIMKVKTIFMHCYLFIPTSCFPN